MKPLYAVILAGDNADSRIRKDTILTNKAFLIIGSKTMLEYVVDCYKQMDELAGIAVVGPQERLKEVLSEDVIIIPQQGSMVGNVMAAAERLKGWLILSSCDIPLLTPEAVRDFVSQSGDADLTYPLVPKAENDKIFPEMKRTYVTLKEGVFTGGNLFVVHSDKVPVAAPPAGEFFKLRKSPLRLARLVGLTTLLRLVTKRLALKDIQERMAKILGVSCKAVISRYPEIGTDLDKESDYNVISPRLTGNRGN